ncbi:type II toxin-antitoxin system RelE/ParE family toxin [Sulfurovum sp.]|uniref:type II toxin-antitoxin system RelE/ParE family toxin n=1 Tax=Sulfurovum sp. TaxID=1969726 RepID=UPI003459301E
MKIKFTPTFHHKLDEVAAYVYQESKSNKFTVKYIRKLQKHIISYLSEFPKLGRPADEFGKGIRKLVHQQYSILYRIDNDYILVITIYKENLPSL